MRIAAIVCSAIVAIGVASSHAGKDIEDIAIGAEGLDLSGTYVISGKNDDTTTWSGEAKISKWQTVTTQRGKTYQMLKMNVSYGDYKYTGVAAFDGLRLFTACREGDKANYFLLLMGGLELSEENYNAVKELHDVTFGAKRKEGKQYEWKGDIPWFGHLHYNDDAYGLYFFSDGTWGSFSVIDCEWPMLPDSAFFFSQYEMKKDGKFEKNHLKQWFDAGKLTAQQTGENLQFKITKGGFQGDDYDGHGMMMNYELMKRDFLVAMLGGPENCFTGCFELKGNQFVGCGAWRYNHSRFYESWAVPDNVVARDPEWFK